MKALHPRPLTRIVAALFVGALASTSAKAGIILTMQEVGSDVVLTSSGTLGPVDQNNGNFVQELVSATTTPLFASLTVGQSGQTPNNVLRYANAIVSGPSSFGTGLSTLASSATGPMLAFIGASVPTTSLGIDIAQALFGQPLTAGSNTWSSKTLAGLGVTPGTYTWTVSAAVLASGQTDTIVLNIVDTQTAPAPATLALFGLGLAGLRAMRRRKAVA